MAFLAVPHFPWYVLSMIQDGKIMPNMGVVVGIRFSRLVNPNWAISLASQAWPTNTNVAYAPIMCSNPRTGTQGPPRDKAAELLVEGALELKSPYIWFIDDDVEVPFGACRQLIKTMKEAPDDVMVVGGIYPAKRNPLEPIVYRKNGHGPSYDWKKDTIFEADLLGLGSMLIKTEVFRHIEKPWFKDVDTETMCLTDDAFFCGKVQLAGFRILADAHVLCTHWDYETNTPYRFEDGSFPTIPQGKEDVMSNIPPGWMTTAELEWLSDKASERKRIVELGSYLGRSTVVMGRSTPGEVWAIDDFKGIRNTRIDSTKNDVPLLPDTFDEFRKNVSGLHNVKWIRTDHADYTRIPVEWLRGKAEEKPDMIFIDGGHDYSDVKRDILAWRERLAPGGLLCGHDRDWPGVQKAINELLPGWKAEPGVIWSWQG